MVDHPTNALKGSIFQHALFQGSTVSGELRESVRTKLKALSTHLGIPQIITAAKREPPPNYPKDSGPEFKDHARPALPTLAVSTNPTTQATIESALSKLPVKGVTILPDDQDGLTLLLTHPDSLTDLQALDVLQSMFPRSTKRSNNRVLLAIAIAVTENFGLEFRLPLTSASAWTMIDCDLFTDELATQFAKISTFVLGWQSDKKDFLLLDPAEITLIETLFESLHPRNQGLLAAKVMDFKVLSNRRMGLVRRFPNRIERALANAKSEDETQKSVQYAKDCLALLDHIARPEGFAPIIEEAKQAAAKIVKSVQRVLAPPPEQAALPAPNPPAPDAAAPHPSQELTTTPPKRLTRRHRTDAALRYLRGEAPDAIGRTLGVKAAAVEGWAEAFLSGGAQALSNREKSDMSEPITSAQATAEPSEVQDLKDRLEQLSILVQSLTQNKG